MTSETRLFIEAKDVIGIQLECTKCHTKLSLQIAPLSKRVRECPSCATQWLEEDTRERGLIQHFLNEIQDLSEMLKGRNFALKIEINNPA